MKWNSLKFVLVKLCFAAFIGLISFSCQKTNEDLGPIKSNVKSLRVSDVTVNGVNVVTRPVNLSTGIYQSPARGNSSVTLVWQGAFNTTGNLYLGSRSQLRTVIGVPTDEQAHHLIPWDLNTNIVVKYALLDGFHPNDNYNGLAVTAFKDGNSGLHANHPQYNAWVLNQLGQFFSFYGTTNLTYRIANSWIQAKLIPRLRAEINSIPSGTTINTYFTNLSNNFIGL